MAVGDLIVGPNYPQYEWNGWLLGSGTDKIVTSTKKFFDPAEPRNTDQERQDAWGDFPGDVEYKSRFPVMACSIAAASRAIVESYVIAIPTIFIAQRTLGQLVYQRLGDVKKFMWARVEKCDFDSDYALAHGRIDLDLMWKCPDPRRYSLVEFVDPAQIVDTGTTVTVNVTNNGSIDARPTFEINGPCVNPRLSNVQDSGRSIKIDVTVNAGQILLVDVKTRTVSLNGVDYSTYVRPDNQWWSLKPGVNNVTYSRATALAPSLTNIRHRDTWN